MGVPGFFGMDFDPGYYVLDEHGEPRREPDVLAWARWYETADRHVCDDYHAEGDGTKAIRVSTVFLGLDHGFDVGGPPVLWETLVFGGLLDGEMNRYTSKETAILGHQEMCMRVGETLHHD